MEPRHDRFIILVFSNYNWCDSSFLFFFFWSLSAQTPDKSYSSNSWVCLGNEDSSSSSSMARPGKRGLLFPPSPELRISDPRPECFFYCYLLFPLSLHVLSDLFCSSGMTQGGSVRRRPSHGAALSSSLLSVRPLWPQRGTIFDTSHRI